jgi:hypothetical protein
MASRPRITRDFDPMEGIYRSPAAVIDDPMADEAGAAWIGRSSWPGRPAGDVR